MRRSLYLTSPVMRGGDVLAAQRVLLNNKWGHFKPGDVDGEYGPLTAAATRRAQYWLGRRKRDIDGGYREELHEQLKGTRKLRPIQRVRRVYRMNKRSERPLRDKAFEVAANWIGTKENPAGSNKVFFSEWYGFQGPWCAMFVTYCYAHAGSKAFARGSKWAYCPFLLAAARAGGQGVSVTPHPERGDVVLFDWDNDGVADHVGLFDKWITTGSFTTIEGNTAVGNDSNGGEVMRRTRTREQAIAFVRVWK